MPSSFAPCTMVHVLLGNLLLALLCWIQAVAGNVLLTTANASLSFDSTEANFAPSVRSSGISGFIECARPFDACSSLESQSITPQGSNSVFLLAVRGNCSFDTKVLNAQAAGFAAAIIFDSEYSAELVTMAGSSEGISIHAVFVLRAAGETLAVYAGDINSMTWILPNYEDTIWSIMVFSSIAVLAIAAALATWFTVRRQRGRQFIGRLLWQQEPCVMSSRVVNAMPSIVYRATGNQKATQDACAICLEDYIAGENLRILPCCHRFHCTCIDAWLTMWRALCPICKRDARLEVSQITVSERTPLLSPIVASGVPVSQSGGATTLASPSESTPIKIPPSQESGSVDIPSCSRDTPCSVSHQLTPDPGSPYIASPVSSSPNSFRNSAFQCSGLRQVQSFLSDTNTIEAFRASPYFTPPSSSRNPSPLIPGSYAAPYLLNSSPSVGSPASPAFGSRSKSFLHPSRSRNGSKLVLEAA